MSEGRKQHSNSLDFSGFRPGTFEEWIQCFKESNMLQGLNETQKPIFISKRVYIDFFSFFVHMKNSTKLHF